MIMEIKDMDQSPASKGCEVQAGLCGQGKWGLGCVARAGGGWAVWLGKWGLGCVPGRCRTTLAVGMR